MFDFPLVPLELAGVVVADVATAPEPPRELIVEVALEMEEVRMGEAVMLNAVAVAGHNECCCCGDGTNVGGGFSRNGTHYYALGGKDF